MSIKIIYIITFLFLSTIIVAQEKWQVPKDKKGKLSTFYFDKKTKENGKKLYETNCVSCHGNPGKKNFVIMDPLPIDPASLKFQINTDGEMYYKISKGKGQMPSFIDQLGNKNIWDIISYLREYNSDYVQKIQEKRIIKLFNGAEIKLDIKLNKQKIITQAFIKQNNNIIGIKDIPIKLYVQRYFGNQQLDEEKTSNNLGITQFKLPLNFKADTNGMVKLIAKVSDIESFGDVLIKKDFKIGKQNIEPSLIKQRALWNNRNKMPLWLAISYIFCVGFIWLVIFNILFNLKKINDLGKK